MPIKNLYEIIVRNNHYYIYTEEYLEEPPLSLDEVEKEMIRKALERHHGKRKSAAKD